MKSTRLFIALTIITLSAAATGCSEETDDDAAALAVSNMETVTSLARDVFSAGKMELIDELVHPDFVDHSAPEGQTDREGFRQIVTFWRSSLSSFDVKPVEMFAIGDRVSMVDETSGVHDKATVFNIPPNGKTLRFQAVHAFRLEDGMMREHWVQTGLAAALEELAAPTP